MPQTSVHDVALGLFVFLSLLSLFLLILKTLGKELEATAVVWIRVWKRIKSERAKPIARSNELTYQPLKISTEIHSKHE